MPKLTKEERSIIEPFIMGEPDETGDIDFLCPLHPDKKRSARINFKKGVWHCFAGCGSGPLRQLLKLIEEDGQRPSPSNNGREESIELVTEAMVAGWHSALLSNRDELKTLRKKRGIRIKTVEEFEIGWDADNDAFTIPVRSADGVLYNVRRYRPGDDGKKIWSVKGMGAPRIYPEKVLAKNESVVLCEGEMDTLLLNQLGFPAVTGTGGATTWNDNWSRMFAGKNVVIMYDNDQTGRKGSKKVARSLSAVADVWVGSIPLDKVGADITDLVHGEGWDKDQVLDLLRQAQPYLGKPAPVRLEPQETGLLASFDARLAGQPLRVTATVKGKRNPPYLVPSLIKFQCTQDKGKVCQTCPLNDTEGEANLVIEKDNLVIMRMIESSEKQVSKVLLRAVGARCDDRVDIEIEQHVAVEELFVRPSIEIMDDDMQGEYVDRKIFSVGRHDTPTNQTIRVVGATLADSENQRNQFMAWEAEPVESSLDHFEVSREIVDRLKVFQPAPGQRPISKLREICDQLSDHVTKIYGRVEMHMAMDLVFHSALSFWFSGDLISRGWLDLLIIGDTRTGKSEAALRLTRHYQAGRLVSCESASFAGIVGGLQQYGAGKEWAISWGVVPLNDRRLVILDEVSGLKTEHIAEMSSVRSSGQAQLTKIQTEQTSARTRLIWLSNPRSGRMMDYTYGCQAIKSLIGQPEDIARFDFAMSCATGDVDAEDINMHRSVTEDLAFTSELCHERVMWAWSRKSDNIKWSSAAEKLVYEAAVKLGARYIDDPPLIQSANVRIKVARLSVALAMATFSCDESGENVLVKSQHVYDAVEFLDYLYSRPGFGYLEISREQIGDSKEAYRQATPTKRFIMEFDGLSKFLRNTRGSFRSVDIEEVMGVTRDAANAIINTLWKNNMVIKVAGDIKIQPVLHELLREIP